MTRNLNTSRIHLGAALIGFEQMRADIQVLAAFFNKGGMKTEDEIGNAAILAKGLCLAARELANEFDNCADAILPGIKG